MSEWLHFLNLQYWYCIIYSVFGGACTDTTRSPPPVETIQNLEGFDAFDALAQAVWGSIQVVWNSISGVATWVWHTYSAAAYAYSAFAAFAIAIALLGLGFIRLREAGIYGTLPPAREKNDSRVKRWKELLELAMTTEPTHWKEAVVEADALLGELLASLKYPGMNTAERMRSLPENAFSTLPVAWEAHRVKNLLTNPGSDFILTQREAFRVMKLYEQIFEEFEYL